MKRYLFFLMLGDFPLAAYVTSFSRGKRLDPGKDKIVPRPVPGAM